MLDWCHIGSIDSGSAIIFNIVGAQSINRNLFSMQLIILVYISINIGETIRTYLYFDRYKQILNKYW